MKELDLACFQCPRKVGRPKGARDKKPRQKRRCDNVKPDTNGINAAAFITSASSKISDLPAICTLASHQTIDLGFAFIGKLPGTSFITVRDGWEWIEDTALTRECPDPFHGDWPYWFSAGRQRKMKVAL